MSHKTVRRDSGRGNLDVLYLNLQIARLTRGRSRLRALARAHTVFGHFRRIRKKCFSRSRGATETMMDLLPMLTPNWSLLTPATCPIAEQRLRGALDRVSDRQIGRASCRERV